VSAAEAVGYVLGLGLVVAVGYGGFLAGRDAAERKAAETIANLRRHSMILRAQRDQANERAARQARALGVFAPPPVVEPDWMSE